MHEILRRRDQHGASSGGRSSLEEFKTFACSAHTDIGRREQGRGVRTQFSGISLKRPHITIKVDITLYDGLTRRGKSGASVLC